MSLGAYVWVCVYSVNMCDMFVWVSVFVCA